MIGLLLVAAYFVFKRSVKRHRQRSSALSGNVVAPYMKQKGHRPRSPSDGSFIPYRVPNAENRNSVGSGETIMNPEEGPWDEIRVNAAPGQMGVLMGVPSSQDNDDDARGKFCTGCPSEKE